jgi:hypothetical protein
MPMNPLKLAASFRLAKRARSSLLGAMGLVLLATSLLGQNTATLPPAFANLPGNAGIAMPLRWSRGKLQVFIDPVMMPANFVGETITGLRLRRSILDDAPAYPAMTRTIEIEGGFQTFPAANMNGSASLNYGVATRVHLFGPAQVSIPATPAAGPATTVGDEFVQITFSQGLPVTAGTLFLQFETLDGPITIAPGNWVDAVLYGEGADDGYAVTVGDGSCTTRSEPNKLRYTSSSGPTAGSTINLEVTGAPPTAGTDFGLVVAWVGLNPETRPPGVGYLGYGGSFGAADPLMADCHLWAPIDVSWAGATDATGKFATSLEIPGAAAVGLRLGIQAAWYDPSRPVIPLSFTNGVQLVCNSVAVEGRCSSFFFPDDANLSPWGNQVGLMPVILLDY